MRYAGILRGSPHASVLGWCCRPDIGLRPWPAVVEACPESSWHALHGLASSRAARPDPLLPPELRSPSMILLGVVCSVLPDLDVVGFRFGVPYGHVLGHRGLSHSIAFAVFLSACLAWLLPFEAQPAQASRLMLFGFLFLSTLSHSLLDALRVGV
jgi:membrane-bound metal-dependent hydrolase YbcI (DUF457 family)